MPVLYENSVTATKKREDFKVDRVNDRRKNIIATVLKVLHSALTFCSLCFMTEKST